MITIAIGADHWGYGLKKKLKTFLRSQRYAVIDVGSHSIKACDYPEFVKKVAELVAEQKVDMGVLICKTGIGSSIAANKFNSIRAALCHNIKAAKLSRSHNDANILVLGADFSSPHHGKRILQEWLGTKFQGGRHERRLSMIKSFEEA